MPQSIVQHLDDMLKPELNDVLKMLLPLSSHWKTIGLLLGAKSKTLDRIKSDGPNDEDRLVCVISWWRDKLDPFPTWEGLADAMENLYPEIATKIRQQYVFAELQH